MARFQVVVSTENNPYLVWQAMLFHYSCLHYLGHSAIVVVHTDAEPLLPGFQRIVARGGTVQTAPNYRNVGGVNYPPRNTAASLRHVQTDADFLVLCDPDMIFLQPVAFDQALASDRQISFDHVSYMVPEADHSRSNLEHVCPLAGVPLEDILKIPCSGGVPHVVPRQWQQALSDQWLRCQEVFPVISPWTQDMAASASLQCHHGPQKDWLATMWGLVLAVHRLGLESILTHWCTTNYNGTQPLAPDDDGAAPKMLHYCYADAGFNKHAFDNLQAADHTVWQAAPDDGTISGAVRRQLREARLFYG